MKKIEINSVYSNRFGGDEYFELMSDFEDLSLPQGFIDFMKTLLPMFTEIMNCVLIGRRYVAFATQQDGTVYVECVLATDDKTMPFLNVSACTGSHFAVDTSRMEFLNRKLKGVYQTYTPDVNDKALDCLPYSRLRSAIKAILMRLSQNADGFYRAAMIRSGGLFSGILDPMENNFQMLDCPEEGLFKAYRVYRDFLNNPVFSISIQSYLPLQLEGTVEQTLSDENRIALLN